MTLFGHWFLVHLFHEHLDGYHRVLATTTAAGDPPPPQLNNEDLNNDGENDRFDEELPVLLFLLLPLTSLTLNHNQGITHLPLNALLSPL